MDEVKAQTMKFTAQNNTKKWRLYTKTKEKSSQSESKFKLKVSTQRENWNSLHIAFN